MLILSYWRSSQRITCPHQGQAVPSSAVSISIYNSSGEAVLDATAATKGALSTSIATAAVAGDWEIELGDVSDLSLEEPLVLTDSHGRTEILVAQGKDDDANTVKLRDPITRDYAVGSAAKSALITYDADLSDSDDFPVGLYYSALFSCSDWEAPRVIVFRVVNRATANPITYEDVRRALSHVAALRDSYDSPSLEGPRALAWTIIESRMLADGRDPAVLRDTERIAAAGGILAAALFCVGRPGGLELAEVLAGRPPGTGGLFESMMSSVMAIPTWFDRDQDLVADAGEHRRPRRTSIRRGR